MVIAIIGILIALLMPAVAAQRETARRTQCGNQMAQVGIGLHAYHDTYSAFPSGHLADTESGRDGKSWGWGALLLPFIEQRPLADRLQPNLRPFEEVASDPQLAPLLQTDVGVYRCPSDQGDRLSHQFRFLIVPSTAADHLVWSPAASGDGIEVPLTLAHVYIPPDSPGSPGGQGGADLPWGGSFPLAARIGKSNYVASIGSRWKTWRFEWTDEDFRGNGLFGRDSAVRLSQVTDGASNTLAVGERSDLNYAAVWAGGNSWDQCGFADNQMVLGSAAYPINQEPVAANYGCDGNGAANFSSYHPGGANFVLADGSVQFLSEQIDASVLENLAQRDDGQNVGGF